MIFPSDVEMVTAGEQNTINFGPLNSTDSKQHCTTLINIIIITVTAVFWTLKTLSVLNKAVTWAYSMDMDYNEQ